MKKKKIYIASGIVIAAVVLTATIFYFFPEINPWHNEDEIEEDLAPPKDLHNPIYLQSMAELEGFPNKTGDGTEANPYRVANLEITSQTSGKAIYLENITSAFIVFENISIHDIQLDIEFTGIYLKNCKNIIIQNIEITNCSSTLSSTSGILCSNVTDSTVINCIIHDFHVKNTFKAIYTTGSDHIQIRANQLYNFTSSTSSLMGINSYLAKNHEIEMNYIQNFYSKLSAHGIYLDHANYSTIIGNFVKNLSCEDFTVGIRTIHSIGHLITDNIIRDVSAASNAYGFATASTEDSRFLRNKIMGDWSSGNEERPRAFYVFQNSLNNVFSMNWILNNTYVRESEDNNTWYSVEYFEPMGTYTLVGNYYSDHNIDSNPNFHYFVETPKVLYDTNNLDLYPIHFFALDFDGDGLNNYQETVEFRSDIWENDTDKDGLSDYEEINTAGTNLLDPDTDGDGLLDGEDPDPLNPNNNYWEEIIAEPLTVALFVVGIAIIANLLRPRYPRPNDLGKKDTTKKDR